VRLNPNRARTAFVSARRASPSPARRTINTASRYSSGGIRSGAMRVTVRERTVISCRGSDGLTKSPRRRIWPSRAHISATARIRPVLFELKMQSQRAATHEAKSLNCKGSSTSRTCACKSPSTGPEQECVRSAVLGLEPRSLPRCALLSNTGLACSRAPVIYTSINYCPSTAPPRRCAISSAARAARLSSGKLVYAELRIKAALRDSSLICVDETGLRVAGSGGYIHVARTEQLTHYAYEEGAFQSAVAAAKITDLHFHDLRHTFSTRMRVLTDPFTLKELLGHSKIETTEGYVTPSMAEMKAAVEGLAQTTVRVLPLASARA
jgi:hypothetical protein